MNRFQKLVLRAIGLKGTVYDPKSREFMMKMSGAPTYSGKPVNDSTAMQVSVAWACVRIITETLGSLPLAFFERDDRKPGTSHRIDYDPLGTVLTTMPNSEMTRVDLHEGIAASLALRGNSYAYTERRASGEVVALHPMNPAHVTPERQDDGSVRFKYTPANGKAELLPREQVWHVRGFGTSALEGLSPIAAARQALGVSLAAEEFQARFFSNGANPSWLLSIPQWLEEDQREIAEKRAREIWQGLDNAHRVAILEGGMTATAATMPLQDAQFMELRGFSLQEICRIYRVPPHMVADLSRSTNNNIEHQGAEFVTFTLAPYLTRIEASIGRWLIPVADRSRIFCKFNVNALLRADAAGRAALYSSALQNGWMTRNEVRALEDRNWSEVAGMDAYTAQSNLLPVDALFDDTRAVARATPPQGRSSGTQ